MPAIPVSDFARRVLKIYEGPRYSPATAGRIRMVLAQLRELGLSDTAGLTTSLMVDYVTWLKANVTDNHNTINGYLSAAGQICTYATEEGWLERQPTWRRVRLPQTPMVRNLPPTYADAAELLIHLRRKTDWEGLRLSALTHLGLMVGPRLRECTYSHIADLDSSVTTFRVNPANHARQRTKTPGSARVIPLPPLLSSILGEWLPHAGPTWLFPGLRRRGPWDGGYAASRPLGQLKRAAKEIGIEHITFHALRHAFGTFSQEYWGMPAWAVQQVMGHTDLRTTQRYMHLKASPEVRKLIQGVGFAPRA